MEVCPVTVQACNLFEQRVLGIIQHRDHIKDRDHIEHRDHMQHKETKNQKILKQNKNRSTFTRTPSPTIADTTGARLVDESAREVKSDDANAVARNDALLR